MARKVRPTQAYLLQLSKIGEQYFSIGWDQTPHVYSTSAQTPYLGGVGSNALTLPPGAASNTATPASLVPFLHQTDVGIERNTASVDDRWTPTDAWDVRADYSHMDRTGTQAAGVVGFQTGTSVFESPTQVAAPVNDTTQNFGTNGEYLGTSPWARNSRSRRRIAARSTPTTSPTTTCRAPIVRARRRPAATARG